MEGPWAAQYQMDENGETVLDEEGNPVVDQTKLNRYQYNSKELTSDLGLNWNDYGARWYDPSIARWNAVDPLAEKNWFESPYVYVHNNPQVYIDPDGQDGVLVINKANKTITVKAVYYVNTTQSPKGKNKKGDYQYFSGTAYSSNDISKFNDKINKSLNKKEYSISEGKYEGYSVSFDLEFKDGGGTLQTKLSADKETYDGKAIGNSLDKTTTEADPSLFPVSVIQKPLGVE